MCALTDKSDVVREDASGEWGLIAAGGAIKQEDKRQVCPPPIYLLQTQM